MLRQRWLAGRLANSGLYGKPGLKAEDDGVATVGDGVRAEDKTRGGVISQGTDLPPFPSSSYHVA